MPPLYATIFYMKVELIKPQGYCAGVLNAVNTAYKAKAEHPNKNIFVVGMLVHNSIVVDELNLNGINSIELTNEGNLPSLLKEGDVIIFGAHGHDEKLDNQAKAKKLIIYDCTCPIVKLNLNKIKNELEHKHEIIYVGQKGHKETEAALSLSNSIYLYDKKYKFDYQFLKDDSPLVINQTTLNYLSLKNIHNEILSNIPKARIENEICKATRERQEAIRSLDDSYDLIIVVGDKKSSNCNKLFEIAKQKFVSSSVYMISNLEELKQIDISTKKKAAISSGASTPISVVEDIYNYLLNYQR